MARRTHIPDADTERTYCGRPVASVKCIDMLRDATCLTCHRSYDRRVAEAYRIVKAWRRVRWHFHHTPSVNDDRRTFEVLTRATTPESDSYPSRTARTPGASDRPPRD